jgi:hypothetical protein
VKRVIGALLFLGAIVAILAFKRPHHDVAMAAPGGDEIDDFTSSCTGGASDPSCPILHAAVVAHVVESLQELRDGNDPKAVDIALEALGVEQPQIQIMAAQLLVGSTRDDVLRAAVPLILGPHPALQAGAADILVSGNNDALRAIGERWKSGHQNPAATSAVRTDLPAPAVAAKYTAYPGAVRYPPGDGPMSMGWRTADPIDKVVAFYARPGATRVDATAWTKPTGSYSPDTDPDMQEVKRLADEFNRTHDPSLIPKMQAAAKKMGGHAKQVAAQAGSTVYARKVPDGDAGATFVGFIVEKDGVTPVRAVAIYREESIETTVVEMIWDVTKYPIWFGTLPSTP